MANDYDLGTASAAEMGTGGDVDLGRASDVEMTGGTLESADDTLAIYNAQLRRMIRLRAEKKKADDSAKEVGGKLAEVEAWVQQAMLEQSKQTEYAEGHMISLVRKFNASIGADNRDDAIPLLQGLGWDKVLGVNAQSLTALIRGKMAEIVEQGRFEFGELSENRELAEQVAEQFSEPLSQETEIELDSLRDEQLRSDVVAYVATPLELRPFLKTYTKVGLSMRKK